MNIGKTLFAQLMDFLPWTTFTRIVDRHGGDRYVKLLACTEQFRVMAFAQLTYRESLRDIEACLSAQTAKLYHMGFRHEIKRSTLADANETRDWRIHAEFAQCLIVQARKLYLGDRKSGSPYRSMSSSPSSRNASTWMCRSTRCYRFSLSPCSRRCPCSKRFRAATTRTPMVCRATN